MLFNFVISIKLFSFVVPNFAILAVFEFLFAVLILQYLFRILLVLWQKQDVLHLSVERAMPITEVILCLGNLQFGFVNNNLKWAAFIFCRNYVVDIGDFVKEALPLTINVSAIEKKLISCFRTISTATYELNTIFNIAS